MKIKKEGEEGASLAGAALIDRIWDKSWTYIKTVVDVVRQPILILDKNLKVMAANDFFYHAFHVEAKDTEGRVVYKLGNGQWNIPELKKLLEDILPQSSFFKGFEVMHDFPFIGRKVMMLNARQIYPENNTALSPIILLAMEDITEMMMIAETLANHANNLETKIVQRTKRLEVQIAKLEKQLYSLRKGK